MTLRASIASAALLCVLCACSSPPRHAEDYELSPDRPEALPDRELAELRRARTALDSGDAAAARAILAPLAEARPDDLPLAVMLQETVFAPADAAERARFVVDARRRAEVQPNVANLLLAARIEPDAALARAHVQRARELDPLSAWASYALAHLDARANDWLAASKHLAQALALDPGHRAARRLEAAMVARGGDLEDAIAAHEVWLAATADDPRIDPRTRIAMQLDLAQLEVLARDEVRARAVLRALAEEPASAVRRMCLAAAVEQALGRPAAALTAVDGALAQEPRSMTGLVQKALLYQYDLEDRERARAAWQAVLDATKGNVGLDALIQSIRAQVVLERAQALAP